MATTTKSLSASQVIVRFGIQEKPTRLVMQKVREAMKSSQNFAVKGIVNVDEYVLVGYKEGKSGRCYNNLKKKLYAL